MVWFRNRKKYIFAAVIILVTATAVYADWQFNPFTGKLDYHSGVSEVNYESNPTLTNLRDALISAGIMHAAPVAAEVGADIVHVDRESPKLRHTDRVIAGGNKIVHEDHLQ